MPSRRACRSGACRVLYNQLKLFGIISTPWTGNPRDGSRPFNTQQACLGLDGGDRPRPAQLHPDAPGGSALLGLLEGLVEGLSRRPDGEVRRDQEAREAVDEHKARHALRMSRRALALARRTGHFVAEVRRTHDFVVERAGRRQPAR